MYNLFPVKKTHHLSTLKLQQLRTYLIQWQTGSFLQLRLAFTQLQYGKKKQFCWTLGRVKPSAFGHNDQLLLFGLPVWRKIHMSTHLEKHQLQRYFLPIKRWKAIHKKKFKLKCQLACKHSEQMILCYAISKRFFVITSPIIVTITLDVTEVPKWPYAIWCTWLLCLLCCCSCVNEVEPLRKMMVFKIKS